MSQNLERTEGKPGMSVKVPVSILPETVTRAIVDRMPTLGFEAHVRMTRTDEFMPVVVFEDPNARGVFTNAVNAAIHHASPEDQIRAVDAFVSSRAQQTINSSRA
jgi:hypothetical protein